MALNDTDAVCHPLDDDSERRRFLAAVYPDCWNRFGFSNGAVHCMLCGAVRRLAEIAAMRDVTLASHLNAHLDAHWRRVPQQTADAFIAALDLGVRRDLACREFFGVARLASDGSWQRFWREGAPF